MSPGSPASGDPPLRPRVALFLDGLGRGGTERHTVRLANALHHSGQADVWVGCLDTHGAFRNELVIPEDRVLAFPLPAFHHPTGLAQIVRFTARARREGWNVLHGQDFYGNVMCAAAKAVLRRPRLVVSRRYEVRDETRLHRLGEGAAYRLADAVVFNSPSVSHRLVAEGRVREHQRAVIPNGIEIDRFRRPGTGGETLPRNGGRRIGIVARLAEIKDHATLVRALPRVVSRFPDLEVVLVGDGPERPALESLARSLGVATRLTLVGDQDDVVPWLRSFDVATLTSRNESSPNAVLEYMAAGLPIVATGVGGIPDLVRDGVEASLVPPGDPEALAEALLAVLSDPLMAGAMAAAARQRVESFSVEAMLGRTLDLYRGLLAGTGPPDSVRRPDGADGPPRQPAAALAKGG